jgi:hypothetical protein
MTIAEETLALKPGVGVMLDPQLLHGVEARTDCQLLLLLEEIPG